MKDLWQSLSHRLNRLSSGWTIALGLALYAVYLATIMPAQSLGEPGLCGRLGRP